MRSARVQTEGRGSEPSWTAAVTCAEAWKLTRPIVILALSLSLVLAGCSDSAHMQTIQHLRLTSERAISYAFNQGIVHVPGGWVLSGTNPQHVDTDLLVRTDEDFNVLAEARPAIPERLRAQGYDHIGDIDVVGAVVYAPLQQPDGAKDTQMDARYDVATLAYLGALKVRQHQNNFLAIDPTTMTVYSMDTFSGDSLSRYDLAHRWHALPPLRLSEDLRDAQGASISGDTIWISTSDLHNDCYRVNLSDGSVELMEGSVHRAARVRELTSHPWDRVTSTKWCKSPAKFGLRIWT